MVKFKNGTTRRYELYYGASFLSQSIRQIPLPEQVQKVEVIDSKGRKRTINLPELNF